DAHALLPVAFGRRRLIDQASLDGRAGRSAEVQHKIWAPEFVKFANRSLESRGIRRRRRGGRRGSRGPEAPRSLAADRSTERLHTSGWEALLPQGIQRLAANWLRIAHGPSRRRCRFLEPAIPVVVNCWPFGLRSHASAASPVLPAPPLQSA